MRWLTFLCLHLYWLAAWCRHRPSRETPGASVQYLRLGPKRPVMETSDLALECGEMLPWIQVTAAGNPSTPQTSHSPKCPGRYAQLKYFPNICGGCHHWVIWWSDTLPLSCCQSRKIVSSSFLEVRCGSDVSRQSQLTIAKWPFLGNIANINSIKKILKTFNLRSMQFFIYNLYLVSCVWIGFWILVIMGRAFIFWHSNYIWQHISLSMSPVCPGQVVVEGRIIIFLPR